MHADASYVKYNIEQRTGDPKSQSKPLSPSFSPLFRLMVSSHSMVDRNIIREFYICLCSTDSIDHLPTNDGLFFH